MANILRFKITTHITNYAGNSSFFIYKFTGTPVINVGPTVTTEMYAVSLDGEFSTSEKLTPSSYQLMLAAFMDKGCNPCDVELQSFCDNEWKVIFNGIIKKTDLSICMTTCSVSFKVSRRDYLTCLEDNWEKEIFFYQLPFVTSYAHPASNPSTWFVEVKIFVTIDGPVPEVPPTFPSEQMFIDGDATMSSWGDYYSDYMETPHRMIAHFSNFIETINPQASPEPPDAGKFCEAGYSYESTVLPNGNTTTSLYYSYVQEVTITNCTGLTTAPPLLGGWQLLENHCADGGYASWWRCPFRFSHAEFNECHTLNDIIEWLVHSTFFDCGIDCVVSDFFGINAPGLAPSNLAYDYALQYLQLLTVSPKGSVVIPDASNPTNISLYEMSLKELLENLTNLFNLSFDFVEINGSTCFRIEHVSYYQNTDTIDISNAFVAGNGCCVSYAQDIKRYEVFTSMDGEDASDKIDFIGGVMIDFGICFKDANERNTSLFNTDIEFMMYNTELFDTGNSGGWVIIQNDSINALGNYQIGNHQTAITNDYHLNAALSWANLVNALWRYDMSAYQADYLNMTNDVVYSTKYNVLHKNETTMIVCLCDEIGTSFCVKVTKTTTQSCIPFVTKFKSCFFDLLGYSKLKSMSINTYTSNGTFSFVMSMPNQ